MANDYVEYLRSLRDDNLRQIDEQIRVISELLAKATSDEGITNEDQGIIKAQFAYNNVALVDETGALAAGCRAGQADSYRKTLDALRRQREFLLKSSAQSIENAQSSKPARKKGEPIIRL